MTWFHHKNITLGQPENFFEDICFQNKSRIMNSHLRSQDGNENVETSGVTLRSKISVRRQKQ